MNRHCPSSSSLTIILALCSLFACSATAMGQAAARPNRGTMPTGSYSVSDIENVSLTNGNLNIGIPLASLPPIAGGKLALNLRAEYNSKLWDTVRTERQPDPLDPGTKHVISSLQMSDRAGWGIGSRYSITFESVAADYIFLPPPGNDPEYNLITNNFWVKVVLTTPDGATHELRPVDYFPYSDGYFNHSYLRGYYKDNPHTVNGSVRYYSFDGSHLWAKIDNSEYCCYGGAQTWTLYLPDGTKVEQLLNGDQRITDTNGNKVKIFSTASGAVITEHYQDEQTGREIKVVYDPSGNSGAGQQQVQYQTVGGVWESIIINLGSTHVFGKHYEFGDFECAEAADYVDTWMTVIRSIVYPQTEPGQNGRQFTFTYNSDTTDSVNYQFRQNCSVPYETVTAASHGWGSLSQMTMPSGAVVNYVYGLDGEHYLSFNPDNAPREGLTTKTLTHDGTSDIWTYGVSPAAGGFTAPDGSSVTEFRYSSDPGFAHTNSGFGGKEELVYRTNNSNKVMVERHWTLMPFTGGDNIAAGASVLVAFNPVVDAEYTSLLDDTPNHNPVTMSARTFQYDYNGNLLSQTDYNWFDPALVTRDVQGVPTAVPTSATVLRVTNNSYYNSATSASSGNVYAKRLLSTATPLILNALQQTTIGPSIAQFSYDGQAYGVAPTVGNLTSKRVWDDLDAKWITTSTTYGSYGNVATTTDGRGKVTQFFYDDSTHSLPTSVIVDPENGTGTQTSSTVYDYSTGLIISQTDPNGQQTTIDYTNQLLNAVDPFGRPGITKAPTINIGGTNHRKRTTTTYLDSARQVIVASDLNAEDDKLLKTRATADMLGRPILTESTEDGTNYTISVRNAYLDMGRVTLTSSPMRSGAAATDSWTRTTKDIAGRVIEVATFGGASQPAWSGTAGSFTGAVTTSYSANFTTVTDQAGKVRRSMTDGLGRLLRVDEPDASGNLGSTTSPTQPTSYAYNVSDNLTGVTQGSQTRTFTYDSLSRLRAAINPESGTVSYQYDDNGNLLVKTDARGVSAHYAYDSLNRVTRRWYNGSSSLANATHNDPALPSAVGATDEIKFYYDSQLPVGAPSYTVGPAKGRLTAQTYGSGTTGDYYGFDVLGRPKVKIQRTGARDYEITATYNLSGAATSLIYPSGHTVSNTFDQAGRLTGFSGNLGDGTTRTYATGIVYSSFGGLLTEQFGTNNAVYHRIHYNSRAQICDIRASSDVNNEWGGELGALVNYYSTPVSHCGNGPDNNGNLLMSQTIINSFYIEDRYTYDSLSRLKSVGEFQNGLTNTGNQTYDYDRWGNRISLTANGTGINNTSFEIETTTNRIYAPGDLVLSEGSRRIQYDAAGNQKKDSYTGAGTRTYDAENKITSGAANNNQTATYAYDGSGQRIKRTVDGVETWQVYGFGGELLAEYPANGDKLNPQKEYGYRNGQLLITAEPAPPSSALGPNFAASSNGAVASASSTYPSVTAGNTINGDHVGSSGWWADNTDSAYPDSLQIDFSGSKTISEIDVFGLQQNYGSPVEPALTMTSSYALTNFQVQYWKDGAWATVPGGSVTGNDKVWRKFKFAPVTTTKIQVQVTGVAGDNHSQVVEIEAYGPVNVAAASNGAVASASSTYPSVTAGNTINGDHVGSSGWWADNTDSVYPDSLQIDFSGSKTISEIDVFGLQQNYGSPVEPALTMTSSYALTNFQVQYWKDGAWATVPGGSVTGNDKVWRKFSFAPVTTTKIQVQVTGVAGDNHSQVVEIEAYDKREGLIQWLVTDHLGTPRMIIDQTGNLANIKRHDYLPFGEELFAPAGGRTAAQGYAAGDGVRQQFTLKERDSETGLDYFGARYYASLQGRFTGVDPYDINFERQETDDREKADNLFRDYIEQPQHWNHYVYGLNNPLRYLDPDGRFEYETELLGKKIKVKISDKIEKKEQEGIKKNIDAAINRINQGADKLTSEQVKAINSMKGIEVRNDIRGSFTNLNNKVFNIRQSLAQTANLDYLTGAIIHDSFHSDQARRGLGFQGEKNELAREREASAFAVDVAERIGLDRSVIEAFKGDARTGHRAPPGSVYTRPPKKKTP